MSKYTKEQQAENRAKWVADLRSGEYRQGVGQLSHENGFCCLGVACSLAVREGVIESYDPENATPPGEVIDWLGLSTDTGELTSGVDGWDELIDLNDHAKWPFPRIADLIESGGVKVQ